MNPLFLKIYLFLSLCRRIATPPAGDTERRWSDRSVNSRDPSLVVSNTRPLMLSSTPPDSSFLNRETMTICFLLHLNLRYYLFLLHLFSSYWSVLLVGLSIFLKKINFFFFKVGGLKWFEDQQEDYYPYSDDNNVNQRGCSTQQQQQQESSPVMVPVSTSTTTTRLTHEINSLERNSALSRYKAKKKSRR